MLPITRVVMFKHGVGYFQRTGRIEGNELIELSFKASQMNDVLKSLTVLDHGGVRSQRCPMTARSRLSDDSLSLTSRSQQRAPSQRFSTGSRARRSRFHEVPTNCRGPSWALRK